jgi:hypothetical protein
MSDFSCLSVGLVYEVVNELRARHSPPDIGGVDATSRRSREASVNGAAGVVGNGTISRGRIAKHVGTPNHPVCAASLASHLFLYGAATPPVSGGELQASPSFTPITASTVRSVRGTIHD